MRLHTAVRTFREQDDVAARGEQLSRPKQCAAVITRGEPDCVPVRGGVGHEGGHAQNVRECYAWCVQICMRERKCPGDTLRDRHRLCWIRPRSPPDPTHGGLHGGAARLARTRRCSDLPQTFQPVAVREQSCVGENRSALVVARGCEARRVCQQMREGGARCARSDAGVREVRAGGAQDGEPWTQVS